MIYIQDAESILVIILSITLAIFLVMSIILVSKLLKFVNQLKSIADTAQGVANNVEAATETLKNAAGPMAIGKMIVNMVDMVKKHKGGK